MQQLRLRLNTKAQHRRGKTHRSKLGTKIGPHSHRAHEALARHKSPDFRRTGPPSRTNTSPQPPKDSTARSGRRPTEGRSITEGRRPGRPEEELRVGVRGTQDLGVNHVSGEELLVSRDKTSRLRQPPPRYHQRRERGALGRAAEQLDNWQQRSTATIMSSAVFASMRLNATNQSYLAVTKENLADTSFCHQIKLTAELKSYIKEIADFLEESNKFYVVRMNRTFMEQDRVYFATEFSKKYIVNLVRGKTANIRVQIAGRPSTT
ncbi:hypothetical protein OsJ_02290 [Oryza sativa Japonica Group]|uniref:Uncharacterized protein n=1 Tax=Oryza sativa subsp. japonica TaxID=39947 RepID=A2ZUK4_ORYSJ|nr:hypothetical protein OsJ_02290 [Oryza sativa Japonica Group]